LPCDAQVLADVLHPSYYATGACKEVAFSAIQYLGEGITVRIKTVIGRAKKEWRKGRARGVMNFVTHLSRHVLNQTVPSVSVDSALNRPRPRTSTGDDWAREWASMLRLDPVIAPGDWSETVFVNGFGYSGSSAAADFLFDHLDVAPPPYETFGFRQRGLPAVMRGDLSLEGFTKQFILGYEPTVKYPHFRAWFWHALRVDNCMHARPSKIVDADGSNTYVDLRKVAGAFLAPGCQSLVLDNAVSWEGIEISDKYANARWLFVVRDLADQYAQRYSTRMSPTDFINVVSKRLTFVHTQAALLNINQTWVMFEDFVSQESTREAVRQLITNGQDLSNSYVPRRFVPGSSAANVGIKQSLDRDTRILFSSAQDYLYAGLPIESR